MTTTLRAAGCVLWRRDDDGIRYAVVHRPRYDDWSLPKGKVDPGETELQTAIREVEEETGLRGTVGEELPMVRYIDDQGRPKSVRYWLLHITDGEFRVNDEVDVLRWELIETARDLLTYPHDQVLLDVAHRRLGEMPAPS